MCTNSRQKEKTLAVCTVYVKIMRIGKKNSYRNSTFIMTKQVIIDSELRSTLNYRNIQVIQVKMVFTASNKKKEREKRGTLLV